MKRKIKILRIINRFNLGGPTYNAVLLTKFLPGEYDTMLIGGVPDTHETDSLHIAKKYGVEPMIIPEMSRSITYKNDWAALKKINRIIENFQPDIVHTHASKAGALGRTAARWKKVPVIVHTFHGHVFHSYFSPIKTRIFIGIERILAQHSDKLIAISQLQKNDLVDVFKIAPSSKVEVIPLGFDLSSFREFTLSQREKFRNKYALGNKIAIGIIGRLAPIKNHELFLEMISRLRKENRNIAGIIIGDGSEKEQLMRLAQSKGLKIYPEANAKEADVLFVSWVLNIADALAGLDIVVLTSKNEGTPVSVIEAMAARKPVVASAVGGTPDIISHEFNGFLFESGNVDDLIMQINKIMNPAHENRIEKMLDNAQTFAFENFHYKRLVDQTDQLYKKLLKQKGIINLMGDK